jgi:Fe-S cluster assembly protein SufD
VTVTPASPAGARPARQPRRGPAELPFAFADPALAERLGAERSEPEWLRAERAAAAQAFDSLPVEANQLYTPYVDLRGADLFEARPYVAGGPSGIERPVADGAVDGLTVESIEAWLARDPAGARAGLEGGSTLPTDDKLAMLARGFWSHGLHVQIADGARLAAPILVRWPAAESGRALITRTIVSLGEGASASIVEEQAAASPRSLGPQALFHGTTELVLGRGASLAMASIQDLPVDQVVFQHRRAAVGEGATLHWALAQLGSKLVRSRVDNRLEGDRSSVEQVEIVLGASNQLFDLTSYTRHLGRDTTGNLLSKGVLLDQARSYMKGLITIERSAVGTDSYLGEFGMNLSKAARAVAIPSLEIDQPDCRRAAHSSSVGPIDPNQLFYLESRGIPAAEARKFIVLGFLEPVVARVPLEAARNDLRDRLEAKWDAAWEAASADGAAA